MRNESPRRPVVLLDVDGVLADFIGGVLDLVEHVTGLCREREDVDRFDFCEALGLRGDDARAVKRAIAERGFCERLLPYEGARLGVRALQEIADVYIVTSPWNSCPTWTYERESWLWRHFKIPSSRVIHARAKHRVAGDVFVDDRTNTVAEWRAEWPDSVAIRWNTPHNAHDPWDGITCDRWDLLRARVRGLVDAREFCENAPTEVKGLDAEIRAAFARVSEER